MKTMNKKVLLLPLWLLLGIPTAVGFAIKAPPSKKVILAIDGGGTRGILSASILKRVEQSIQKQTMDKHRLIGESFDMIAGTSTGGILASYFSMPGLHGTANGALDMYKRNAEKIFGDPCGSPSLDGIAKRSFWARKSRHSGDGLDEVLRSYFGNSTFKDLAEGVHSGKRYNPSLLLVSYDVKYRRPVAFVADRLLHKSFLIRQEPLGVPFSPPYEAVNATKQFPGDINRRMSVVRRWIDKFNTMGGKWLHENGGTKFGPINFLGDVQILRNEVADAWCKLECNVTNEVFDGSVVDQEKNSHTVIFAKANFSNLEVWEAARASSSAPTFLPPMKIPNFYYRAYPANATGIPESRKTENAYFCDGGIVANNPGLQALLYLMAHDAAAEEECNIGDSSLCEEDEEINQSMENLRELPEDWTEYSRIDSKNPLDNYALLSVGSGSTSDRAEVEGKDWLGNEWDASDKGSELWWIKQGAKKGNLISALMDNSQMIAHTNLRTMFALAGRENAYLRIQYRTNEFDGETVVPELISESLKRLDVPDKDYLAAYQDIGDYVAGAYAGVIDQFVFLHILTDQERSAFIKKDSILAQKVFNGIAIPGLGDDPEGDLSGRSSSSASNLNLSDAEELRPHISSVLEEESAAAKRADAQNRKKQGFLEQA